MRSGLGRYLEKALAVGRAASSLIRGGAFRARTSTTGRRPTHKSPPPRTRRDLPVRSSGCYLVHISRTAHISNMSCDLEDKVAIVTGASSGIGEAIVVHLVEAGLRVAGLARRIERVEKLSKSLEGKKGALYPVKCDVSDENEVKNAFAWVEANLGPPTVLINNAGVLKQGVLTEGKAEDMKQIFNTNVVGLAVCSREAIALMIKNNIQGTIVNINSTSGHRVLPVPGIAAYNASKYAVTALTEALRNELSLMKTNIRVTSLSPGLVESEMSDQLMGGLSLEQPILKAKDIADCVIFILKAPQYVNVSELTVTHVNETSSTISLTLSSILAKAGA